MAFKVFSEGRVKYVFQETIFVKNILVLEMPLGQSHWKCSLKSGHEIIRGAAHRSKNRNTVNSWVHLDKKKSQVFATKWKETYQTSHKSEKKPLGKKEIDVTKLFKIITTSKAPSHGLRLRKKVVYEQFTQDSYKRDHIVKCRNESM